MDLQVWKFPIRYEDYPEVSMPEGAKLLHFGLQRNVPTIWALVDPLQPPMNRLFRFVGTGHQTSAEERLTHIGTTIDDDHGLVWHLFERHP